METKTAILIDGGFYRKRARSLFGVKTAEERANEIWKYCVLHLRDGVRDGKDCDRSLYRVFYYDCPPLDINVFHPLTQNNVDLKRNETFAWTNAFFKALLAKRKFALRLGRLANYGHGYRLDPNVVKKLCAKTMSVDDLTKEHFSIATEQKGVDMKIGIDIVHLAYKRLVTQIILISGDSDFVPAAKLARREGIDFILDPMRSRISDDLLAHVDGLYSHWNDKRMKPQTTDSTSNEND